MGKVLRPCRATLTKRKPIKENPTYKKKISTDSSHSDSQNRFFLTGKKLSRRNEVLILNSEQAREYMRTHATEILKPDRHGKGFICPICGSGKGEGRKAAGTGITTKDGIHFTCWTGCFTNSDIIDIIGLQRGLNENDHVHKFEEALIVFGIEIENPNEYKDVREMSKEKSNFFLTGKNNFQEFFRQANLNLGRTDYHRGISLETLNRFQVGYVEQWRVSEKSPYSPRLIIPTYEEGYLARDTRTDLTEQQKPYAKIRQGHIVIYNERALYEAESPIFIVDGELDCLSLIDVGENAVALGSTVNVKKLLALLKQKAPKQPLIISLDNDEAGQRASNELEQGLSKLGFFSYRQNFPEQYKDANEFLMRDREALKSWISQSKRSVLDKFNLEFEVERESYQHDAVSYSLRDFFSMIRESREGKAIPTGFDELDTLFDGGLYPGLYVLGAISSLGKTTLALQIADQIAQSGHGVLIFSLEMSRNELMAKTLSRLTFMKDMELNGVPQNAKTTRGVLRGKFYGFENDIFMSALEEYEAYGKNIHISEGIGDIGVSEIAEKVREYMKFNDGKPPVVVIDYLQILAPYDIRATDKQNTDKAVLELKRLSRDYQIPVIAVSSFNRESYFQPVSMASFKESGAIEYSSDVLMGLQYAGWDYQENEKEIDRSKRLRELLNVMESNSKSAEEAGGVDTRVVQLKILKHRNGRKGNVYLEFVPKYNYFKATDRSDNGCPF